MPHNLTADEVLAVLHAIERNEITITNDTHDYCSVETCRASNGWTFYVFNDCGEWDYVERVETDDGRCVDLWTSLDDPDWNRACDQPPSPERTAALDAIAARDGMEAIRAYEPPCGGKKWGW